MSGEAGKTVKRYVPPLVGIKPSVKREASRYEERDTGFLWMVNSE